MCERLSEYTVPSVSPWSTVTLTESAHHIQCTLAADELCEMGDERQDPSFNDSPVRSAVTIFNEKRLTLPASSWPRNDFSFAMDVGGTLAKLVYISSRDGSPSVSDDDDASSCDEYPTVELTMVTFDAENVEEMLQYVTDNVLPRTEDDVTRSRCDVTARATGVGCVRNRKQIIDILEYVSLQVDPRELEHCVGGIGFMWRNLPPDQLLYVDQSDSFSDLTFQTELRSSGALPCIVVNMGSALTIMQVNEDGKVAGIVGGSSQGGMTFIGLGRLLTKAKGFSELIAMATRGCRQTVDLTVGDVAGTEYNRTASDVVVSSFGKVARLNTDPAYNEDDLAASLLYCIVDEMIKTVYIVAKAQQVHVAMFCGSFLTNNPYLVSHVRHKINVCSTYLGHKLQSLFLKHEGYLGAIGLLTEQLD